MFKNLSLTWRVLLVSLLLGSVLTFFLGRAHVRDVHETLQDRFFMGLTVRAREGRIRLDNYVKLHHYSTELFITQKKFIDYLEQVSPDNSTSRHYHQAPPWFPDRSIQRTFIKAHHFLLLDASATIRESFSRGGSKISSDLQQRIIQQSLLSFSGESWIINMPSGLFLISSQSLKKFGNSAWSQLMMATRIEDEFILASQGLMQSSDLFALVDEKKQAILASGDVELIPVGVSLETLSADYLIESDAFFDYGNSDVIIKLALFAPKQELQILLDQVDRKSLIQIILISLTFMVTFTLVFLWFVNRLNLLTLKMIQFPQSKLGIEAPTAPPGGAMERLQNQFNLMAMAISEARKREEKINRELAETNGALLKSLKIMKRTQTQLFQSEMMAALGGLVAGVAHEINTPLGIGITTSSYLQERTQESLLAFKGQCLSHEALASYFDDANESTQLIEQNLLRAGNLVRSFKRVAVDQTNNEHRTFNLQEYIRETLFSLRPKWKRTRHLVHLQCPDTLLVTGFPGAIAQILTNLIVNSLKHAFPEGSSGSINIDISQKEEWVHMHYRDDGKGISSGEVDRIFEPFYTTARAHGGIGLGMHIVFNLVTQTLGGNIECHSMPEAGVTFKIHFPVVVEAKSRSSAE